MVSQKKNENKILSFPGFCFFDIFCKLHALSRFLTLLIRWWRALWNFIFIIFLRFQHALGFNSCVPLSELNLFRSDCFRHGSSENSNECRVGSCSLELWFLRQNVSEGSINCPSTMSILPFKTLTWIRRGRLSFHHLSSDPSLVNFFLKR